MAHKRPNTYHLWLQLLNESQIPHQVIHRLIRTTHHHPRTGLISNPFQRLQTSHSILIRHPLGVQTPIMLCICRLVSKQISICSSIKPSPIILIWSFTERQRDCLLWPTPTYLLHHHLNPLCCMANILTTLQHKRLESKQISLFTTLPYLLCRQSISLHTRISGTNTTIQTIIPTIVRYLNQSARLNLSSKHFHSHLLRLTFQPSNQLIIIQHQQLPQLSIRQTTFLSQYINHIMFHVTKVQKNIDNKPLKINKNSYLCKTNSLKLLTVGY